MTDRSRRVKCDSTSRKGTAQADGMVALATASISNEEIILFSKNICGNFGLNWYNKVFYQN